MIHHSIIIISLFVSGGHHCRLTERWSPAAFSVSSETTATLWSLVTRTHLGFPSHPASISLFIGRVPFAYTTVGSTLYSLNKISHTEYQISIDGDWMRANSLNLLHFSMCPHKLQYNLSSHNTLFPEILHIWSHFCGNVHGNYKNGIGVLHF